MPTPAERTTSALISPTTFKTTLARYDDLLSSLSQSSSKGNKAAAGRDSLKALDDWRLRTLPDVVAKRKDAEGQGYLTKPEVEDLVKWKL